MAEYCLNCFNKYFTEENEALTEKNVILKEDLCEGCGEIKPCVMRIKTKTLFKLKIKSLLKN